MLFCIGVSAFRKKSLIKDGMCRVENSISLCNDSFRTAKWLHTDTYLSSTVKFMNSFSHTHIMSALAIIGLEGTLRFLKDGE